MEIAPLKPGNGNRQRPRLLNPLTLRFRYFLTTALTKKLIARTAYQEFLSFLNFYKPVSLNKIMFMSIDVTLTYPRAFFMDPL
jgi:hypothetical protein